jgi:hypothetical protein
MNLTQDQVVQLNNQLLEIPGKYGLPIIQLLQKFFVDNNKGSDEVEKVEEPNA